MIISSRNIDELYVNAIEAVLTKGVPSSPRNLETKELISPLLILEPQEYVPVIKNKKRKLNYAFQIIETLQYVDGSMEVDRICWYNKNYRSFINEETNEFDGAYGPRFKGSFKYCLDLLKKDPSSRRAVVSIFNNKLDHHESKDVVCTVSFQFLIRNGKLDMIANMRSNDILWGTPYDIMAFTFIQHLMASWLNIKSGRYFHHPGSLHAYNQTFNHLCETMSLVDLNEISYGQMNMTYEETMENIKIFFFNEGLSRDGCNVGSTTLNPFFQNLFDIIKKYNQKKYAKNSKQSNEN